MSYFVIKLTEPAKIFIQHGIVTCELIFTCKNQFTCKTELIFTCEISSHVKIM